MAKVKRKIIALAKSAADNVSKPSSKRRKDVHDHASFVKPPLTASMPADYAPWLAQLKSRISQSRLRAVIAANASLVLLYWEIGRGILHKQAAQGWGSKVIDRLAADLRHAFPDMRGFSPRNLKYMRAFAQAWPDESIVQRCAAQLPWRQIMLLLDKCKDSALQLWYTHKSLEHGWSRDILALQIQSRAHTRHGKSQHNFASTLPPADSDMAAQVFKDPYLFDFLGTADTRREREVEQALVDHMQRFLLELGQGFAFVGRQVRLEIGDQDFQLDLLFYHLKLRRYVVLELKARAFEPGDGAQLGMYMTAVDRLLRHADDGPTMGLLLVREKNRVLVEYALGGICKPITVAEWDTQLTHALPRELQSSLPTIQQIEAELARV